MVRFYRFLSIAMCLLLSIGVPVKLISRNQSKKKSMIMAGMRNI